MNGTQTRMIQNRPAAELKRVRRRVGPHAVGVDYVVYEFLDRMSPQAGSCTVAVWDGAPPVPATPGRPARPARTARTPRRLQHEQIADVTAAVLRDTGRDSIQYGETGLFAEIARRLGLGPERRPRYHMKNILASLSEHPGGLVMTKTLAPNGRHVRKFSLGVNQ